MAKCRNETTIHLPNVKVIIGIKDQISQLRRNVPLLLFTVVVSLSLKIVRSVLIISTQIGSAPLGSLRCLFTYVSKDKHDEK